MTDVQDMDALVSTFNAFEMKEAGPLVLAWAVFLYLLLTLVEKDENNELMVCGYVLCEFLVYYLSCECITKFNPFSFLCIQEIDHISYVRQAFEAGSLRYCLEILECDILKEYDVRHSDLGSITCYSGLVKKP